MNYTYVPLPLVEEAQSVSASAQVLVIDDGEVKRTDAANIGIKPTGKLTLTNTTETDCTNYATAQIVDANLLAENIKKDVTILGQTGSYEGGGSSDFTEKTITLAVANTDEQHYTYFTYGIHEGVIGLTGEVTALVESNDKWCLADTVYMNNADVTVGTHTINLLMTSDGELQFIPASGKVLSVSGDIELVQDPDDGDYYLVTGNCTINVDMNPA